jgi:8-oxo-dGTP diphosphatase
MQYLDVLLVVFSLRGEQLQVLLAPGLEGHWELPGSPVPGNTSLEETATESVLRMTGLREAYLEQLYTYGEADRVTPRGERRVSVAYFVIIPAGNQPAPNGGANSGDTPSTYEDAQTLRWFPIPPLMGSPSTTAHPLPQEQENPALSANDREVIGYALRRLRYKLEYTAIGFQLLPEQFSLSQLQRTYELILGETLDKRNFRRRILQAGIIEETPHRRAGEGRPARLYRYRPDAVAEIKARRLFP